MLTCKNLGPSSYLSPQPFDIWDYVQQLIDMDLWAKWSFINRLNVRREWSRILEVFKTWLNNPSRLGIQTHNVVWPVGRGTFSLLVLDGICLGPNETFWLDYMLVLNGQSVRIGKGHVEGTPTLLSSMWLNAEFESTYNTRQANFSISDVNTGYNRKARFPQGTRGNQWRCSGKFSGIRWHVPIKTVIAPEYYWNPSLNNL